MSLLLALALVSPAEAALTAEQAAQLRTWLFTDGLTCGAARTQAQTTFDVSCPSVLSTLAANLCYTRLAAGCVANDADGDGFSPTGGDCNDADPGVYPGAPETCDGLDEDCDGTVDEGLTCGSDRWLLGTSSLSTASVVVRGSAASAAAGSALDMGDVNGDGYGDLLVSARGASTAWLFLGPVTGIGAWSDADATYSGAASSNFGWSVAFPGDSDGDGYGEVAIGAPNQSSSRGAAYLWEGTSTGALPTSTAVATLTGDTNADQFGVKVCPAGDQDGDGRADLLVGSWQDDRGASNTGSTLIYFGALAGSVTTAAADAVFYGELASDWSGYSACGGGDLDADGWDDLVIGADGVDTGGTQAGAGYVLYGPVSGTSSLSTADAERDGLAAWDYQGQGVGFVGDVTGDGRDDLAIGAFGRDQAGRDSGAVYLYSTPITGVASATTDALIVSPPVSGGYFGYRAVAAGDVDADGYGDMLVTAFQDDEAASNAGAAYLVYGPVDGSFDLATDAAKLLGEAASDEVGFGIAGGADLDGDGYDDVAVGAKGNDSAGSGAGALYLYLSSLE